MFLDGLFIYGNTTTLSSLENRFYTYLQIIKKDLNSKKNKYKIFVPSGISTLIIFMIIIVIFLTIKVIAELGDIVTSIFSVLFPLI
jgi:hypothetical protein